MVQLHSARARVRIARPTSDVDIVLHVETGATTLTAVQRVLEELGYNLSLSIDAGAPAHRFVRGREQVDVMIADHVAPRIQPKLGGRRPFRMAGGTQALRRTVDCEVATLPGESVLISVPNQLGALVLKGAAYLEDSRDRERHLEDAAVLSICSTDPLAMAKEMRGSDRSRIGSLYKQLGNAAHPAWAIIDQDRRQYGRDVLRILSANNNFVPIKTLRKDKGP
jgi:hypothetical protein